MSELLLQVLILVAFGTFCFGCGYLTAFIVTRNGQAGVARYNRQMGMARAAERIEDVGSAMIQGAADRGEYPKLPDLP